MSDPATPLPVIFLSPSVGWVTSGFSDFSSGVLSFVTTKFSVLAVNLSFVNTTGFPLFPSTVSSVPFSGFVVIPYSPSFSNGTSCLFPFLSVSVTTNLLRSSLPSVAFPST